MVALGEPVVVAELELEAAATDWAMDVLIEVHTEAELERAARLGATLIGINNRDLHTFETTLDTTRVLSKFAPADRLLVCESGLFTPEDLAEMDQQRQLDQGIDGEQQQQAQEHGPRVTP